MSSIPKIKIFLLACAAIAACAILYVLNPETTHWFPKCPFYLLSGWQCPSCGTSRAIYHFLHGDILGGLAYNPFILVSWPLLCIVVYLLWRKNTSHLLIALRIYIVLFFVWWILRNVIGV